MVDICWSEKGGWHRPRVSPYGPIQLDPAAAVLHYAQEIFEGLKAYRHADGSIRTFRPYENAARMQRSARRLALPELPERVLHRLAEAAHRGRRRLGAERARDEPVPAPVHVRQGGVPRRAPGEEGRVLPHREPRRRVLPRRRAARVIWLSTHYARAGKGGTGAAKTGGNYASSLLPQAEAYEKGCQQVLFLDEGTYLEELGGMNVVLV